jgi:hypothetical protein
MEESEWGKRTMNESRGGVEALGELSRISFLWKRLRRPYQLKARIRMYSCYGRSEVNKQTNEKRS